VWLGVALASFVGLVVVINVVPHSAPQSSSRGLNSGASTLALPAPPTENTTGEVVTPPASPVTQQTPLDDDVTNLVVSYGAHGVHGVHVLIPRTWTLQIQDGGGSGSTSTWTDPLDPNRKVIVGIGVELASWYETDGVAGSIDPMFRSDVQVVRFSNTTFGYRIAADPYPLDGVWIAEIANGQPYGYLDATVQMSPADHDTATRILNSAAG
jgi:hypothetical protein